MEKFLRATAWIAETPRVYGAFHLWTAVFGILAAAVSAAAVSANLRRRCRLGGQNMYMHGFIRKIDLCAGIVLIVSEIYKQLFCYYIVNDGQYDWHLFPFQLCSLPMYLCLILPWIRSEKLWAILNTFMVDFNLMGASMVFVDPSGIFSSYVTLTIHGILWHLIIIFIGLVSGLTHQADTKHLKGFTKGLPVFAAACCGALLINIAAHPYGGAAMFYIDPNTPSVQLVFKDIAAVFGIAAGNIVYIFAMLLGGFVCHVCFWIFQRKSINFKI